VVCQQHFKQSVGDAATLKNTTDTSTRITPTGTATDTTVLGGDSIKMIHWGKHRVQFGKFEYLFKKA